MRWPFRRTKKLPKRDFLPFRRASRFPHLIQDGFHEFGGFVARKSHLLIDGFGEWARVIVSSAMVSRP